MFIENIKSFHENDFYSDSSDVDVVSSNKIPIFNEANQDNQDIQLRNVETKFDKCSQLEGDNQLPTKLKRCKSEADKNKAKQDDKEFLKREKEVIKKRKELEKKEIEFEKNKKKLLQQETKNLKPGECLKHIVVMLDEKLAVNPCGACVITLLHQSDIRHEVCQQTLPNSITFWRSVTSVVQIDSTNKKLETKSQDVLQEDILLFIPLDDFISMIYAHSKKLKGINRYPGLSESTDIESFIENCFVKAGHNLKITLLIVGLKTLLKPMNKKHNVKQKKESPIIDNLLVEEAELCLQLKYGVHIKKLETVDDFAKIVFNYTKAIAETPFKQALWDRQNLLGGESTYLDNSNAGFKITTLNDDKDDIENKMAVKRDVERVWREMLKQFKNVSSEVSGAIVDAYPTPRDLIEAYLKCNSSTEAEKLLANIPVRRGAGLMATSRNVGPELSRRVYWLMSSHEGNQKIT